MPLTGLHLDRAVRLTLEEGLECRERVCLLLRRSAVAAVCRLPEDEKLAEVCLLLFNGPLGRRLSARASH